MRQRPLSSLGETFRHFVNTGDRQSTVDFLNSIDLHDLLYVLDSLSQREFQAMFALLGQQPLAELLSELEPEDAARHLVRLNTAQAAHLADRMDPDDAADVLFALDDQKAEQILTSMLPAESRDVRQLLAYPPESAGGLMTPQFVAVRPNWTIRETIQFVRTQTHGAETIYYIYVTDNQQRLLGVVSLRDLIMASDYDRITDVFNRNVIFVSVDDDQEDVAKLMSDENFLAVPVVDFNHKLVGIVTVDDVLDVLADEFGEDMLKFGAIEGGDERPLSAPALSIKKRLPWLSVNIALSLVGVLVISLFQDTLERVVVLAVFLPVISNMGGNVGIQAVSVAIRGISTHEAGFEDVWNVLRKELVVGIVNGLVLGAMLGAIAQVWYGQWYLALVITLGLWANVLLAGVCGGTLPFLLNRLGKDPAMMTGPLLTTIVDLISFLIFLGLGTLFLPYLSALF